MITAIRKLFHDRAGVTAIEFALLAPILFLLTFGIIEFSLIMFTSSAIESATHIGSRLGKTGYFDPNGTGTGSSSSGGSSGGSSSGGTTDDTGTTKPKPGGGTGRPLTRPEYIRALIRARVGNLINYSNLIIESRVYPDLGSADGGPGNPNGGIGQGGEVVEYTVRYKWPVLTPIMKQFLADKQGNYDIVSTMLVKNEEF